MFHFLRFYMFTVGENIFYIFDLSVFIYNGLALYHFGKYLFCQQCCGVFFRIASRSQLGKGSLIEFYNNLHRLLFNAFTGRHGQLFALLSCLGIICD
jgi:hypothetical protein